MAIYRKTYKIDRFKGIITKYKGEYFVFPLIAEGWGKRVGPLFPDLINELQPAFISTELYEWLGIPRLTDSEIHNEK
jgi:hypothetical protein